MKHRWEAVRKAFFDMLNEIGFPLLLIVVLVPSVLWLLSRG